VTQDISVWAPEGVGSWPIVYAIHGNGADRSRWDVTGPALAAQGVVVFAPDYRSTEPWNYEEDIECSWRYVASIAAEYGGDLDQPITFVGHSLGATMVLVAGLDEEAYGLDGMYDGCLSAAPMPNVIVPISGCRYEYGGDRYDFTSRVAGASNTEANLVLVVGSEDASCEPWQSQDATGALQSAGYSARFVEIDGADHLAVIAKEVIDGQVVTLPDTPAGDKVVQTILEVIDAAGT
jgi:predicted esterase